MDTISPMGMKVPDANPTIRINMHINRPKAMPAIPFTKGDWILRDRTVQILPAALDVRRPGGSRIPLEYRRGQFRMNKHSLQRGPANQNIPVVIHPDHRGRKNLIQGVGYQFRPPVFPNTYEAVCSSQIYSEDHLHKHGRRY
jgi:hypothetical protein